MAARGSDYSFYLYFAQDNRSWKYYFGNTTDIISGTYASITYLDEYVPDLDINLLDAAFKYDADLFIFKGKNIVVCHG